MRQERAEVLRMHIAAERDVFIARQRGRELAALAGFENQDQIRVATALSELCRELAPLASPGVISLSLVGGVVPAMLIEAILPGRASPAGGVDGLKVVDGIAAAARLVDGCTVTRRGDDGVVALTKKLPAGVVVPVEDRAATMREAIGRSRPGSALDVLFSQNQDLLQSLESLQARQEDLLRANAELEETNRGVLALHGELTAELEETNRGVVALYAELDEASSRLREASESKTRFWANVSHELRTPLNSILGLVRLLLDPGSEHLTPEQRHQVELIRDSGGLLLSLVNELLDVAKAESGQIEAQLEPTDLREVFGRLRASLQPLATTPGVELVIEEPEGLGMVRTDPVLLGRILRNLVSNGLKFTERGEVRCAARVDREGRQMEVVVTDTGIGIPAADQRRVFEEFYQVPGQARARSGGTGLGLPYARLLAGILGGSLELTSESGRGTRVELRLPLDVAGDRDPARLGSVLVVDDDHAFRAVLHRILERSADRVTHAADGPAALRALHAERPDLVLLDLHIPAPDGATVLDEMRRDPVLARVPVVVVTSAKPDVAQRRRLGATATVLDKSDLTPDALLAAADLAARLVGGAR